MGGGPAVVLVLRAGRVRELSDDDEVRDDVLSSFELELLLVVRPVVVVVRWAGRVVVVCGGLFVVVSAGDSSLLLLPSP
jgi:hypothetical protein